MSGYGGDSHSHEDKNNIFGNDYVNFDQFLMQHNFGGASSSQSQYYNAPANINYSYSPYNNPSMEGNLNAYNAYNDFYQAQPFSPNLVQNSNLMATASEFVPNFTMPLPNQMPAPGTSPLMANAVEFVPRNAAFHDNSATLVTATNCVNDVPTFEATTANANHANAGNNQPNLSNQEALLNALRKTRIEDASSVSTLSSSGGAIKKVKNGNPREGNQRNHNNNDIGSQAKHQLNENGVERNGSHERKRDARKAENSRRYGTGRTASQYDNGERYNHPNDYFADKYKDRQWNGNQYGNGGGSGANDKTNGPRSSSSSRYNKEKKSNDATAKRIDEFRANRNGKGPLKPKVDATNCSQREKLIREIDSGRLECLVCCEMIKPSQSIWSCSNCYHIIHLKCVIQWAASSKSEEGWRCCACQNITKKVPHEYFCFCGKLKNPLYNRSDVAHSCGDCCGRTDGCVHPCTQLCHPGPCPPCQATVTRKCGCGRSEKMMQCCQKDDLECDEQCEKELNCNAHRCGRKCHGGTCDDCDKEIEHKCFCGREQKMLPCTVDNNKTLAYSCGEVCDKELKCGNHRCRRLCHVGDCDDCKLLPSAVKTCPCGKMQTGDQRTSCTDPIPLCAGNCKKPLTCGQPAHPHVCQAKCHDGPCPPCNKQTSVKCRCGNMDQMMKCVDLLTRADDARCKKRCTKKRSCGKHKCNQECCIDIDHICPLPCTYSLSCGKHKCDQTCHKGRCQPCYRSSFDELHCECGANVIYPPVPCGTKRPACDKPCSRAHPCDHPVTHNCHSAQNCPPCMAFTTQYCYGKHEQRKIVPCSQQNFSCGLPCNRPLKCRQHKCQKPCHPDGQCETETDACKQQCKKKSRVMCPHNCNAPCHLESPCPDTPCREVVEVLCQCGLRKQMRTCHDFSSDYRKIATSKLASSVEQMQNGGMVELSDVLGPIKMSNNKTLECTEECRVAERNRRLAIGLQIRNPDMPSKLQPKYSEFVRGWAKKDAKLVNMIHEKLTELVKLAKHSAQKSRSFSFPIMNREKRQLVHEMCAMFGVVSVAYDAEPNRNIVATATRDTSWLPGMSIMETIQRESGQRRIPVPSLNAWGIKR